MKTPSKYRQMEHVHIMQEMARLFKPALYIEFGVKRGYTFNAMSPFCSKAVAVDPVDYGCLEMHDHVQYYKMTSLEFSYEWSSDEKADFIFIDADHNYKAVLGDIARAKELIKPFTGLIFMHDTYPIREELLAPGYCSDAWRAARAVHKYRPEFEIVTLPGPWAGLSIVRYVPGCHGWMGFMERQGGDG